MPMNPSLRNRAAHSLEASHWREFLPGSKPMPARDQKVASMGRKG